MEKIIIINAFGTLRTHAECGLTVEDLKISLDLKLPIISHRIPGLFLKLNKKSLALYCILQKLKRKCCHLDEHKWQPVMKISSR